MQPETLPPESTSEQPKHKMTKRTKLALLLMIGPTALLIGSFIGFAIVNLIFNGVVTPSGGSLFSEPSVAERVVNIFLFLAGAVSVATGLPGLIVGIVLLATPKK